MDEEMFYVINWKIDWEWFKEMEEEWKEEMNLINALK